MDPDGCLRSNSYVIVLSHSSLYHHQLPTLMDTASIPPLSTPPGLPGDGPILVAGLPGVPGYNAFFHLRALFPGRVLGFGPPRTPSLTDPGGPFGPGILPVDPEDAGAVSRAFDAFGFATVVDATGWCALKPGELDPALARRLNVDVGLTLMTEAKRRRARLIRLSSDLVFDGLPHVRDGALREGDYREVDPVTPITIYGKMMAEAETRILDAYPEAAVLRASLPMGPSLNGHAGAIDWIESRFRKGRPATLYYDEVRSCLYVQDLNRALAGFLGNGARGIFHLGGSRPLSLFQIAQVINRAGGYPPELLMGCPRAEAGPMPPRAGNVGMNTEKVRALLPADALGPWPSHPAMVPEDRDWHRRRDPAFPEGSVAESLNGKGWPDAWDHPGRLVPS